MIILQSSMNSTFRSARGTDRVTGERTCLLHGVGCLSFIILNSTQEKEEENQRNIYNNTVHFLSLQCWT